MAVVGKRLRKVYESVDRNVTYKVADAIKILTDAKNATRFDETLDICINLNVDVRKADQQVRGVVQLPNGTGKKVRIGVFCPPEKMEEAKKAGADIVGSEDLVEKVSKGEVNFDKCISTPDMMGQVGKLGKVLGPKGLMPNPKVGTVTMDLAATIKALKAGQVEYRTEKNGIVHAGVGKISFDAKKLEENFRAFAGAVIKAKPSGVKGTYLKKVVISSTMGPGLKVDLADL
jgi:large subunit ribosomal protein L1